MRGFWIALRRSFLTGLVLVLPLAVTAWILYTGFKLLVSVSAPFVKLGFQWIGHEPVAGVTETASLVITVALLVLLGLMVRSYLGKRMWQGFERLLMSLPVARPIYSATKQLLETFQREKGFQRVALVEFPRKGCWTMGFITSATQGDLNARCQREHYNVFVPTTPNPTSGYLVILPADEVLPLDISVEEGLTFIMSAGAVNTPMRIKGEALL
ncbi:MAG: DUF502 domain-containing protein [Acidobacteriota bacterium]